MKCTIYANYGLLGHEKETVYHTANSAISDALTVLCFSLLRGGLPSF